MIRKRFRKQKEFSSHAISVLTMVKVWVEMGEKKRKLGHSQ